MRTPKQYLMGLAMVIAAGLSIAITPQDKIAERLPSLETMIPQRFGDWVMDDKVAPIVVDPTVQANLGKIYDQILSRTYINGKGELVMLSIAYGNDQRDSMRVHKPEVCYPAQGFAIIRQQEVRLNLSGQQLAVKQLVAQQQARIEPITYWIVMGDRIVIGDLDKKLVQMRYMLTGTVPDGLLFRISSIESDVSYAYALHHHFLVELLTSMDKDQRVVFFGEPQEKNL